MGGLRQENADFLTLWEASWTEEQISRVAFSRGVSWANHSIRWKASYPLLLTNSNGGYKGKDIILGAITLDAINF